jgi:hypothetical protein
VASEEVVAVATVEAVAVSEVAVEALAVVATVIPIFNYLNLGFE